MPAPALAGQPAHLHSDPLLQRGTKCPGDHFGAALEQRYENIEVIAINDGSSDDTAEVLDQLTLEFPRLRVIHLAQNQGKAIALQAGAAAARSEFLVCIDGDALLDRDAAAYLVAPLIRQIRTSGRSPATRASARAPR